MAADMPETLQDIYRRKIIPIDFERSMGLLGATTLGVGALMGAGIYVLLGLAVDKAGPGAWLSYLICGGLSMFSVLMYGELSRKMPIAGGGYAYAYNMLGSLGGFLTGWLLVLGSIFACAMYATGFAYYITSIFAHQVPEIVKTGIAMASVAALTLLNCYGTKGGDRVQRFFTYGNLAVLFLLIVLAIPKAKGAGMVPMFPTGVKGVGEAISIIYVSFFGYQLIANNAEEVINPTHTIPNAMILSMLISLTFYVLLAIVSVMVVPWTDLAKSDAPLVDVALKGIGGTGWIMVAFGGILASGAALNSTLLSQARQVFAMGKDRFLPAPMGKINAVYRTPIAALLAGGAVTMACLFWGNLTFIVKSANFFFIVSLLPISFALRKVYRKFNPGFVRRFIPEVALAANMAMLMTIDLVSMGFGIVLTLIGILFYLTYSRKGEIRARTGMSVVLTEERESMIFKGQKILVPVANPRTAPILFAISESLLANESGEIVVLNVKEVPNQVDFRSALTHAEDSLHVLEHGIHVPSHARIKVRPIVRMSRSLVNGIIHAAEEEHCNLIVMGYAGEHPASNPGRVMEEVLQRATMDTILFKQYGDVALKRIAVSLGSAVNLPLMVKLAGAMADRYDGEITFLNILPESYTAQQKAYSGKILMEAIHQHVARSLYHIDVFSSKDPLKLLVEKSSQFNLLITGTQKVKLMEKVIVGSFSSQLAMQAQCSVAIVRMATQVKKLLGVGANSG